MRQQHSSQSTQRLSELAAALAAIHPADILQGATLLTEFASREMRDPSYKSPYGDTHSELEEQGAMTLTAWRESMAAGFTGALEEYAKLLDLAQRSISSYSVSEQLQRIRVDLRIEPNMSAAEVQPAARFAALGFITKHAGVLSGTCLALLTSILTSDHLPLWEIAAALAAVAGFGGLMFRVGKRHPVQTSVALPSGRRA